MKQPLPGVVLAVLAGVGTAGGGLMIAASIDKIRARDVAAADLADRQARFAAEPDQSLTDIDTSRKGAEDADADAASFGAPLLVGGIACAGGGVVGLGVGLWLALTHTEIDGGVQ